MVEIYERMGGPIRLPLIARVPYQPPVVAWGYGVPLATSDDWLDPRELGTLIIHMAIRVFNGMATLLLGDGKIRR